MTLGEIRVIIEFVVDVDKLTKPQNMSSYVNKQRSLLVEITKQISTWWVIATACSISTTIWLPTSNEETRCNQKTKIHQRANKQSWPLIRPRYDQRRLRGSGCSGGTCPRVQRKTPSICPGGGDALGGLTPRVHRKTRSRLLGGDALGGVGSVRIPRVQMKDFEPTRGNYRQRQ